MEACPLQLPQRLLLLGATALTASALHTAYLVDLCGRTWQADGLLLRSHSASRRFYFMAPDTDSRLWMRAATPGDRSRFQFRFFLVYSLTPAAPNTSSPAPAPEDPCAPGSYLQFYEGPPGAPCPLGARFCGLIITGPVASSGDFLGLRLVTRGCQPRVDFVGEVSSFRLGGMLLCLLPMSEPQVHPPEAGVRSLGTDNCGDGSDQASWAAANCRALGSVGPLGIAAERSPPARRDPARQDAAPEGGWLLVVTCCCSFRRDHTCPSPASSHGGGWPPRGPPLELLLLQPAGLGGWWCAPCYTRPGQVAPGGLRLSK
ncbi:hypothetical protein EI555_014695, partial [Monodon monoceros]